MRFIALVIGAGALGAVAQVPARGCTALAWSSAPASPGSPPPWQQRLRQVHQMVRQPGARDRYAAAVDGVVVRSDPRLDNLSHHKGSRSLQVLARDRRTMSFSLDATTWSPWCWWRVPVSLQPVQAHEGGQPHPGDRRRHHKVVLVDELVIAADGDGEEAHLGYDNLGHRNGRLPLQAADWLAAKELSEGSDNSFSNLAPATICEISGLSEEAQSVVYRNLASSEFIGVAAVRLLQGLLGRLHRRWRALALIGAGRLLQGLQGRLHGDGGPRAPGVCFEKCAVSGPSGGSRKVSQNQRHLASGARPS